jgi:hypothetical protein
MSFFFFRHLLKTKATKLCHDVNFVTTTAAIGGGIATMVSSANIGGGAFVDSTNNQWWNGSLFDWSATNTLCDAASGTTSIGRSDSDEATDKEKTSSKKSIKSLPPPPPQKQKQSSSSLLLRRMTNVGRFSLVSETKSNLSQPTMVLCMTGRPFKPEDFIELYKQRQIPRKHPRFVSHLNKDRTHFVLHHGHDDDDEENNNKQRKGHFHQTTAPPAVEPYVREVMYPLIPRAELKDRINDAISEPLDLDRRLWEVRTATNGVIGQSGAIEPSRLQRILEQKADVHDVESLLFFRAHHCMADGVSLGALFGDFMDEGSEFRSRILEEIQKYKSQRKKVPWYKKLLFFLYYWCYGTIRAILYQIQLYWMSLTQKTKNPWSILRQMYAQQNLLQNGDEMYESRSLSWLQVASLDEVKRVTEYYSARFKERVTINDIFCSCVSAAIVKLLQYHRAVNPRLREDELSLPSMNMVIPVHMLGGILLPGQSIGNKIGAMVSRVPGEEIDDDGSMTTTTTTPTAGAGMAEKRLLEVNKILTERKQTPAAALAYLMASFMGFWSSAATRDDNAVLEGSSSSPSSSWTSWVFEKAHADATVVVTNVRGPDRLVHIDGRPVHGVISFLPLPPGIPIGIVVSSYNGQVSLSVTAEPWAVPNADQFLEWVSDEYQTLLNQVDNS